MQTIQTILTILCKLYILDGQCFLDQSDPSSEKVKKENGRGGEHGEANALPAQVEEHNETSWRLFGIC